MFEPHPNIQTPSDDAIIWRYLDINKLLFLLNSSSLYLCRLDNFRDPWEGTWPRSFISSMEPYRPTHKPIAELHEELKDYYHVSCWHESSTESAALWDLYAKNSGFSIQSTIGLLKKSILDEKKYHIGRVRYVDFESDQISPLNMLIPPFLKRKSFEHEREIRVLNFALSNAGNEGELRNSESQNSLKVDPNILIENLYVSPASPEWLVPALQEMCIRFGVKTNVIRSSLYDSRVY